METLRSTFRPLPSADYVLFQLFMRDAQDRMTLSTFVDYDLAMESRLAPEVHSWQLRRWNGERMVIQAMSTNWFTIKPAVVMARYESKDSEVVDGLLVENTWDRTYIYFTANPRQSEVCLKIYNGRSMIVLGDVTSDNYAGFLKAVALAPRYMKA